MTKTTLHIATINIQSVLSEQRKELLNNFCVNNLIDVIGLQEVRFSDKGSFSAHYEQGCVRSMIDCSRSRSRSSITDR